MSRRESRSSLGARQGNALEEFENFKKKYLLVNKHIAKLNSSLNIRIEELLSQIAVLNNDNLRLRASELSLARKLANEQDRTRRLYKETESASQLLMDQVNSMKIMFGLDRPANPVTLKTVVAPRPKASRPSQPPVNRVARAPEFDMINETAEEEMTPSKQIPHRDASSPTLATNTPTRRRSTGSTATPRSTPASNASMSPDDLPKIRNSGESRKSTPPISMEISNNSSPFSPSPVVAITNQPPPVSPSPAASVQKEVTVMSPPTVDTTPSAEKGQDGKDKKAQGASSETPASSSVMPHLNLFGLKRVSRRPSGLLKGDPLRSKDSEEPTTKDVHPAVSVSIPPTDIPKSTSSFTAYPTPLSPNPAPCTPPRQPMVLSLSDSEAPITSNRKLPMSPVLTANPALSPPPAKKLSLTRRQLDFGITESEDEDEARNSDEGFLDFRSDNRMGRQGRKRKILEDEEDDLMGPQADKEPNFRGKKQERRRDTGTVLTTLSLKEKESRGGFSAEGMESKESLRDVTNERSSASNTTQPQDTKQTKSAVNGTTERPVTVEAKLEARGHVSVGLAARLQRLESRAQAPLVSPIPLPPPEAAQADGDELEQPTIESMESSNAIEIGRRGSGRVRKSVNYKEPSLVSKMRKPDPTLPPSTSSSARSSGDVVSSVSHRPPKRKKGSVSLVEEILGSGASSTTATPNSNPESSKGTSEGDRVRNLTESLLRTKRSALDADLDLSSSDEELQKERDGQFRSTTESGIGYTLSANNSRTSFSRGLSILAKGSNPIINSASSGFSSFPTLTSGTTARIKDPTVGPPGRTPATEDALGNGREGADVVAT